MEKRERINQQKLSAQRPSWNTGTTLTGGNMASAINGFFIKTGGYSDAATSNEAHVVNITLNRQSRSCYI